MAINFTLSKKVVEDPNASWAARPWKGWDPDAALEEIWENNRGIWQFGSQAEEERIATLSWEGKVVLVAAITGIEEVGRDLQKSGRRRALQGFVLPEGHRVREDLMRHPAPRNRNPVAYHNTSELDAVLASGTGHDSARRTFLLTHNPEKWTWPEGEVESFIANSHVGIPSPDRWSMGTRKQGVLPGDRALLLRQGVEPRGLIASGTFTGGVRQAEHWDGSGRTMPAADVQWEIFLDTSEILPVAVLKKAIPGYPWQPQSSGQKLDTEVATVAWELWEEHTADLRPTTEVPGEQSSTGQGRIMDARQRKALEDAAQHRLETYYRDRGWIVQDVRFDGPYDAIALKDGQTRYLEAKGTTSHGAIVTVTGGEVAHARHHPGECVIGILSGLTFTEEGELDETGAKFVLREWNPMEEDLRAMEYQWSATHTTPLRSE
ncbi:protein NO VEIN domain-containing protein [Kocuria rosea]|uniref:protein NO VEIN domain-containing protein n=1 Tax=Kocuria rosea TaxID=1275 RepID=UPI00203A7CCF|nr:DUF3883 domain-containing protein [Kocuria rosea]